jgi:hypothetical protein
MQCWEGDTSTHLYKLSLPMNELQKLRAENRRLRQENADLKSALANAKDPSPIVRISLKRVLEAAKKALMTIVRWGRGWLLRMGNRQRYFKTLKEIWALIANDFTLSEIFPNDESLAPAPPLPKPKLRLAPIKETFPWIDEWTCQWRRFLVHDISEFF